MDKKRFGEKLHNIRSQQHLSMLDFGYSLGITAGQVSDYENAKRFPSMNTIRKIASGLNMTISDLLSDEDAVQPNQDSELNQIMAIAKTLTPFSKKQAIVMLKAVKKVQDQEKPSEDARNEEI